MKTPLNFGSSLAGLVEHCSPMTPDHSGLDMVDVFPFGGTLAEPMERWPEVSAVAAQRYPLREPSSAAQSLPIERWYGQGKAALQPLETEEQRRRRF